MSKANCINRSADRFIGQRADFKVSDVRVCEHILDTIRHHANCGDLTELVGSLHKEIRTVPRFRREETPFEVRLPSTGVLDELDRAARKIDTATSAVDRQSKVVG